MALRHITFVMCGTPTSQSSSNDENGTMLINASTMVQYDTSGTCQQSHSLSSKPQVGYVQRNSLRVSIVSEPEELVQLP